MAVERMSMIVAALVALTTAPVLAQIAGTGEAQTGDCLGQKGTLQDIVTEHAFTGGGTDHGTPSPLIVLKNPTSPGEHTRMHVGKVENWTAAVAIGEAGRCAYDQGQITTNNLVNFHVPSHRVYYPGQEVARACTWYGPEVPGGTPRKFNKYKKGWFTVRLYGAICDTGLMPSCTSFRPGGHVPHLGDFGCSQANATGYRATFAPGPNCGPARWPTKYLHEIGAPPYAEWCDLHG